MSPSGTSAEIPRERPRALELADRWEALGYVTDPITPELEVEWTMVTRLSGLNQNEQIIREIMDFTAPERFDGPFAYVGDGRPSLNYHTSHPDDPHPEPRIEPRELKMLTVAVDCAEKTHEIFKKLELEPVPEATEGDFSWLEVVARNAAKVEALVKKEFQTDNWEPGFQYVEACVRQARPAYSE